jgi:hypothetical protein
LRNHVHDERRQVLRNSACHLLRYGAEIASLLKKTALLLASLKW